MQDNRIALTSATNMEDKPHTTNSSFCISIIASAADRNNPYVNTNVVCLWRNNLSLALQ